MSGAREAWLADEIGATDAAPVYLKATRLGSYGTFLGIIIGATIGLFGLHLNFLVGGLGLAAFGVLLWFLMEEKGFSPTPAAERETLAQAKTVYVSVLRQVKASRGLLMLMFAAIVFGAFSEGYDRLAGALLVRELGFGPFYDVPVVVWWAALAAVSSLTTIGLVSWAERRLDVRSRATLARALTGVVLAIAAGATFLALIGHLWIALALFIFLPALRGLVGPLETAWINQLIDSRSRATVISMHGQADALGQTAAGPTVGWGALHFGLGPAIATAALALVPAAWLYRRAGDNAPGPLVRAQLPGRQIESFEDVLAQQFRAQFVARNVPVGVPRPVKPPGICLECLRHIQNVDTARTENLANGPVWPQDLERLVTERREVFRADRCQQ